MFNAQAGEVALEWRGQPFKLVFDFAAIAAFEAGGASIFDALDHLQAVANGRSRPRVTLIATLIAAGLQRHHPEITAEAALEMVGDPAVWGALFAGYAAAMPAQVETGDADGGGNPPPLASPKRKAKARAGTGRG